MLSYEEWAELMEEELTIEFSELGRDRELDFNLEDALEKKYEQYLKTQVLQ